MFIKIVDIIHHQRRATFNVMILLLLPISNTARFEIDYEQSNIIGLHK